MEAVESKAEVYLMALRSLSKAEKQAVIRRLLEDRELREDIIDLAVIESRRGHPSRPYSEYVAERKARSHKG